jgi:hypothetical protein
MDIGGFLGLVPLIKDLFPKPISIELESKIMDRKFIISVKNTSGNEIEIQSILINGKELETNFTFIERDRKVPYKLQNNSPITYSLVYNDCTETPTRVHIFVKGRWGKTKKVEFKL